MKKLYALLIGINNYPVKAHQLKGCIHDRDKVHDFLKEYCLANQIKYNPTLLSDNQATRQNIINRFAIFDEAKEEDICIFYFSGHGSQMPAPKEFWREELDQKCETLVCYDSRIQKGRDLIDKELSYLIWKYTHQKDVHFLAIFDCCHSGTISRSINDKEVIRMTTTNGNSVVAQAFEGINSYKLTRDVLAPPESKHIVLSASQASESSYELIIGGQRQGIFTFSLIEILKEQDLSRLSYANLISLVGNKVNYVKANQHPQINSFGDIPISSIFLSNKIPLNTTNFLTFSKEHGWILALGYMHGINAATKIYVQYQNDLRMVSPKIIKGGQTVVDTEDWMQKMDKYYPIIEISNRDENKTISFYPKLEESPALNKIKGKFKALGLQYVANPLIAKYWIHILPKAFGLSENGNDSFLFQPITRNLLPPMAALDLFAKKADKVIHWHILKKLQNPISAISPDRLLQIHCQIIDNIHSNTSIPKNIVLTESPIPFKYGWMNNEIIQPGIKLSLKNISNKKLWIAALFLNDDFSVTDKFLPVRTLEPNGTAYEFTDVNDEGYRKSILPIYFPDKGPNSKKKELFNYFKIIICLTPFDTSEFLNEKVEPNEKSLTRGIGFRESKQKKLAKIEADWCVKDIVFKIQKMTPKAKKEDILIG